MNFKYPNNFKGYIKRATHAFAKVDSYLATQYGVKVLYQAKIEIPEKVHDRLCAGTIENLLREFEEHCNITTRVYEYNLLTGLSNDKNALEPTRICTVDIILEKFKKFLSTMRCPVCVKSLENLEDKDAIGRIDIKDFTRKIIPASKASVRFDIINGDDPIPRDFDNNFCARMKNVLSVIAKKGYFGCNQQNDTNAYQNVIVYNSYVDEFGCRIYKYPIALHLKNDFNYSKDNIIETLHIENGELALLDKTGESLFYYGFQDISLPTAFSPPAAGAA